MAVGTVLSETVEDVVRTKAVSATFYFWRYRALRRCERTDQSDLICFVCLVSKGVAKESSAAVEATLREKLRGVKWTRLVSVLFVSGDVGTCKDGNALILMLSMRFFSWAGGLAETSLYKKEDTTFPLLT